MGSTVRRNLTYSNVMATAAVFIAIGGSAYAGSQIKGADIANDAIKSKHISDGQVKGTDIKDAGIKGKDIFGGTIGAAQIGADSLTGAQIADQGIEGLDIADGTIGATQVGGDSLTGSEIDESTLSGVAPSGAAGGDLTGNFPNPGLGAGTVGAAEVVNGSLDLDDTAAGVGSPGNTDLFATINANTCLDMGVNVPGSASGDYIMPIVRSIDNGLIAMAARQSGINARFFLCNTTDVAITSSFPSDPIEFNIDLIAFRP